MFLETKEKVGYGKIREYKHSGLISDVLDYIRDNGAVIYRRTVNRCSGAVIDVSWFALPWFINRTTSKEPRIIVWNHVVLGHDIKQTL